MQFWMSHWLGVDHPQPTISESFECLIDWIVDLPQPSISESSARTLGCIIVDILTLDSLYNDVHWQDPDFRKVTTER